MAMQDNRKEGEELGITLCGVTSEEPGHHPGRKQMEVAAHTRIPDPVQCNHRISQ